MFIQFLILLLPGVRAGFFFTGVGTGLRDLLLRNRCWNRENNNSAMDKPGRYHLNQAINIIIFGNKTYILILVSLFDVMS